MDYDYLAQSLAALAGVPVRIYMDGTFRGLYHHTKFKPDLAITEETNMRFSMVPSRPLIQERMAAGRNSPASLALR